MRRLPRVAICIALGFVTTVLVAWSFALGVVVTIQGTDFVKAEGAMPPWDPYDEWEWWLTVKERTGLTVVVREPGQETRVVVAGDMGGSSTILFRVPPGTRSAQWPQYGARRRVPVPDVDYIAPGEVPGWVDLDPSDTAQWNANLLYVDAISSRGWPMRALWYRVEVRGGVRDDLGSVPMPEFLRGFGPGMVLPYRPVLGGLAFNTIFYAGAWYTLLVVPAMVIRRDRQRRGRCPNCAYDLRAAEHACCPECGFSD